MKLSVVQIDEISKKAQSHNPENRTTVPVTILPKAGFRNGQETRYPLLWGMKTAVLGLVICSRYALVIGGIVGAMLGGIYGVMCTVVSGAVVAFFAGIIVGGIAGAALGVSSAIIGTTIGGRLGWSVGSGLIPALGMSFLAMTNPQIGLSDALLATIFSLIMSGIGAYIHHCVYRGGRWFLPFFLAWRTDLERCGYDEVTLVERLPLAVLILVCLALIGVVALSSDAILILLLCFVALMLVITVTALSVTAIKVIRWVASKTKVQR